MIKKKILIATGGTGGHVFPALSLAKNLIKKKTIAKSIIRNPNFKFFLNFFLGKCMNSVIKYIKIVKTISAMII